MNDLGVFCGGCSAEIESCDGEYGNWMHTGTRQEIAADGHQAAPETVGQFNARCYPDESLRARRGRTVANRSTIVYGKGRTTDLGPGSRRPGPGLVAPRRSA